MSRAHEPEYIEFIARLRHARKAKRLTQAELGRALGKPQTFVSKVETCERRLDVIEAAHWCIALGARLQDTLPIELKAALDKASREGGDGGSDH